MVGRRDGEGGEGVGRGRKNGAKEKGEGVGRGGMGEWWDGGVRVIPAEEWEEWRERRGRKKGTWVGNVGRKSCWRGGKEERGNGGNKEMR